MLIFASICNILTAVWILVAWIRESRQLPKAFVRLMSLRYVRFYIMFALIMNRFIRFQLWRAGISGNAPVPYWPLTGAEKGILLFDLLLGLSSLGYWYFAQYRKGEPPEGPVYVPFHPVTLFYPVMMPELKIAKGRIEITFVSVFSTTIWMLGWFNVLATLLFSAKNVR